MKKTRKLHMIGNAHIDPVWLWQWQEGFQEIKATFRSALDRMQEYDDFIFTCSSAAFYEWVEQNDSDMFMEIQERVAQGRWWIVGGWWVQSDCNIPCGESFVRQGLYGQRYFHEKFSVLATCGYNVDSFGHHGMLPQILKKSGLNRYVFMRPMPNEKALPARLFNWEANDGSQVLAFRLPYEYCTWGKDLHDHVVRCADEIKAPFTESMCFYGVGNHGGGPTRANIESIHLLAGDENLPALEISTPDAFFDAVGQANLPLPVYHGDLQHHASGCYAAHSGVKQWNRRAENALLFSEKFSTLAEKITGQRYPTDFNRAWKNVLFNQFHDILAGTSLKEAYDDAGNQYGEALSISDRNTNHALQSLSWAIDIEEIDGAKPIVVFNPHSWEVTASVELEFGKINEGERLFDDLNSQIPYQLVRSHAAANGRNRVCFVAKVPALGYRLYQLVPHSSQPENVYEPVLTNQSSMENRWYRIDFNPETGCIDNLYDKEAGFSLITGQGAQPWVLADSSDTWSHGVYTFLGGGETTELAHMRLIENGPVKAVLEVTGIYGNSRIIQHFSMYQELKRIDVHVIVDWHETLSMLKLRFPVNLEFRKAVSEIPYGHIDRVLNGEEEPGQSWVDLSGQGKGTKKLFGLSIVNDCKYSYDFDLSTIDLTVLRSPVYAHHDPKILDLDRHHFFMDQGIQEFNYTLLPHTGNWQKSAVVQLAAELNQGPFSIKETYHKGTLPKTASYIHIDKPNIIMTVLKKAENGEDVILRCFEAHGEETAVTIDLPLWNCSIQTIFGPSEIKTFRIGSKLTDDGKSTVVETNLLEWTDSEMSAHRK